MKIAAIHPVWEILVLQPTVPLVDPAHWVEASDVQRMDIPNRLGVFGNMAYPHFMAVLHGESEVWMDLYGVIPKMDTYMVISYYIPTYGS